MIRNNVFRAIFINLINGRLVGRWLEQEPFPSADEKKRARRGDGSFLPRSQHSFLKVYFSTHVRARLG
jgi:hypothetical protein